MEKLSAAQIKQLEMVAPPQPIKWPSVAIMMPAGEMIYTTFAVYLGQLLASTKTAEVCFAFNMGSVIHNLRNGLVTQALENNLDYLLFLDTDILGPANLIDRMLAHKRDIVACTYRTRKKPHILLGNSLKPDDTSDFRKMRRIPGGCMLVKMDVFRKVKAPWFEFRFVGSNETSEDYVFSEKVTEAGYDIWLDWPLSLELGHLTPQAILTSREYSET